MVCESRLARPVLGLSRRAMSLSARVHRVAVLPISESAFAWVISIFQNIFKNLIFLKKNNFFNPCPPSRPAVVDIAEYKYPGNPSYPGIGPKAIAEQWETEERTVHYVIPKTFVEFLEAKLGKTGLYTFVVGGGIALLSKVWEIITSRRIV